MTKPIVKTTRTRVKASGVVREIRPVHVTLRGGKKIVLKKLRILTAA